VNRDHLLAIAPQIKQNGFPTVSSYTPFLDKGKGVEFGADQAAPLRGVSQHHPLLRPDGTVVSGEILNQAVRGLTLGTH